MPPHRIMVVVAAPRLEDLGDGDHLSDQWRPDAHDDRKPRPDEADPERRRHGADAGAEHAARDQGDAGLGRQVQELPDRQGRRHHGDEHDKHVLESEQHRLDGRRLVLNPIAQRKHATPRGADVVRDDRTHGLVLN